MENNHPTIRPGHGPQPGRDTDRPQLSAPRAAVLEALRAQPEPVTLAALSTARGLHENTVREHLDALISLGLVARQRAQSTGRGRPAWLYSATGDDVATAPEYAGLAAALASTVVRTSRAPAQDAALAGRDWGRALADERGVAPADDAAGARAGVLRVLDDLGFAPRADEDGTVVRLERCPLLQAAHQYPDVVCAVHLGLTRGILDRLGVDDPAPTLEPFAEPGACVLRLEP